MIVYIGRERIILSEIEERPMHERRILIPFILITLATFVLNVSMQMSLPTFSVYLKSLDFPVGLIGAASLAVALAAMFFRPVSALLNRRIGSVETGLIGASLYLVAFLSFLTLKSPIFVVMARVIQGIGMGLVITTMGTLIAQIVPHDDLLKGMNIYSLFASSASAVGPYLGMFLIAGGTFSRLFLSAAGMVLLGILILSILKFKVHLPLPHDIHTFESGNPILKSNAVFPTVLSFLSAFVYASIASYLSLYGLEIGIPNIGFFFLYSFAGLLISRLFVNPILRSMKLWAILASAGVFYGVVLFSLSYFTTIFSWSIIAIAFGFIFNLLSTLLNTMAIKNVPISDKANANALLFVGLDSGFFLGGLIWGQVAQRFTTVAIYQSGAVLIVISLFHGALHVHRKQIKF